MRSILAIAAAALLLPVTASAQSVSVSGTCPGPVTLRTTGVTPGGNYVVLRGGGGGASAIPGGPCAGSNSGLDSVHAWHGPYGVDGAGSDSKTPTVPDVSDWVTVLDVETCMTSRAVELCAPVVAANPECSDYTVLTDGMRHVSMTGDVYCDNDVLAASLNSWHRFLGDAGTQMPEWAPGELQCSTHAPGWLDGAHPRGLGDTAEVRTCWQWAGSDCNWESETTVTNCGPYYVYYLRDLPFACSGVFCGE
jgi:hypothetical protein